NVAQIRVDQSDKELVEYAKIFNAPFTVFSRNISKSYRATCARMGKPILLFEGGKSQVSDKAVAREGVFGVMRILHHFDMLNEDFKIPERNREPVTISKSTWVRAKYSGLLHLKVSYGDLIEKGGILATITDPYGTFSHKVKSLNKGYIININEASLVYQGDAIFHISTDATDATGGE
ncbi:MAG: succinylglutamate desuccinylase/aspartoacylase family protein, partial [Leeuwenhoekiella sp.]